MSFFLSIDPGVKSLGWAAWEGRELKACGLLRSPHKTLTAHAAYYSEELDRRYPFACARVCERMMARGKFSIVDAQDLIDLNLIAGRVGTGWLTPADWKGSVPRAIEQGRTKAALSAAELALLPKLKSPTSVGHDVWSAVGIGLSVLGRAHKKSSRQG